jgi:integrase
MANQILQSKWSDKSKTLALTTLKQYADFIKLPFPQINFKAYDNKEMFVPSPEMVKQFIYRIRKTQLKAMVLLCVETGGTASELWSLKWNNVNLQNKIVTIVGVKGHKTCTYQISNELVVLLSQLPRNSSRVFSNLQHPKGIVDSIEDYRKILFKETGNSDFLKITFHSFRHYAISWFYFKSKDIVATMRFARHHNIQNTLWYVHVVKSWVKENEYDVVYATDKEELSKFLSEGYEFVVKTEYGYCLRKPKYLI